MKALYGDQDLYNLKSLILILIMALDVPSPSPGPNRGEDKNIKRLLSEQSVKKLHNPVLYSSSDVTCESCHIRNESLFCHDSVGSSEARAIILWKLSKYLDILTEVKFHLLG